jgi:hypothetical protein
VKAIRLARVTLSRRAAWVLPSLQLGEVVCLGATLVGALAAAAVLWRQPVGHLRARIVRDATVLTGLGVTTVPLLRRLARSGRSGRIVVIEPDSGHPLLAEARATGARVMIGDPTSARVLRPVLSGWRGCALSHLYALRGDVPENEAVLAAAQQVLCRYRPDPERQPHLVARIDDPRHADHWRGWHSGSSSQWFEDALSSQESTACALVSQVFRTGARQLLLCGDSTLALAILLELARRAWERRELIEAAAVGGGVHREAAVGRAADPVTARLDGATGQAGALLPLQRLVLLDRRSEDLRREYLATSPHSAIETLPVVAARPDPWKDQLLAMLDAMTPTAAAATAVVVADTLSDDGMHEAGRVARLHPGIPVFVLTSDGAGMTDAVSDLLQPFQRTLLVGGEVPEDTWTRLARHWHECYRLSHPPAPGDPRTLTNRPWAELDEFMRQDNILQLRSVMAAVVSRGRRWVPARAVPPGSFIELNDHDLEEIARAEHTRWYKRRLRAGWSARPVAPGGVAEHVSAASASAVGNGSGLANGSARANGGARVRARVNSRVVPWAELPAADREAAAEYLRLQLAQLEDVGFVPIVPEGGPPEAAKFQRIGVVRARRLRARRPWVRRSGDQLCGDAGDWRVIDEAGDERTVRDVEFRASHEPLSNELWRRTGTYSAWRVTEEVVLRTMEGRAVAQAGDWVVEGFRGERWPISDEQFRLSYLACEETVGDMKPARPGARSTP